jgi:hypothetical protein
VSDKGYPSPPHWGLGVRLTSLPSKNSTLKISAKDTMAQKQAECHRRRQRQIKEEEEVRIISYQNFPECLIHT